MAFLVLGVNHKNAPLIFREQIAFAAEQLPQALDALCQHKAVGEAVIVSTCNRTELYLETTHNEILPVMYWLADYHGLSRDDLVKVVYHYWRERAVEHVIKVAAGLDSMMLGEPQILGQVKSAYHIAVKAKTTGTYLCRLFQFTFAAAKRIRSDTAIGRHPVSIAYGAVKLAQQLFSHIDQRNFLLIGAGETMRLVAQYLVCSGIRHLAVANRDYQHASDLVNKLNIATDRVNIYCLSELIQCLSEADVVFTATASPKPIISKSLVKQVIQQRRHRPVMMIDLAVPRDVAEEVSELEDVYLYTIDHLQHIVEAGQEQRKQAAMQAEMLVEKEVNDFLVQLKTLEAADVVKAILARADQLKQQELSRAMQALKQGVLPEKIIHDLAYRLTAKIMHRPVVNMKKAAGFQEDGLIVAGKRLFDVV